MSRAGALALILLAWLPIVAVLVLAGFAVGWWATLLGALAFVIFGALGARRHRQLRDQPPPDATAVRAELLELERRSTPWIKAWASCFLALTAFGVVLLLVTAFQMR